MTLPSAVSPSNDTAGEYASRGDDPHSPSDRPAFVVFVAVQLVAIPLYMIAARRQWFFLDEWDFLAHRAAWNLGDLFRPHNEHWSTLPILWYRLLWQVFGLHTYVPYQLTTIVLHLVAALLLRAIMRRAGVGPWIATIAASAFVLFVSGSQDIVWGFQVGFDASLVFGLAALLLNDHDGPIDRRDSFALGAGLLALMCSGVGVTMVFVVTLATLLRRGVRPALLQAVPLGAVYGLWFATAGRTGYARPHLSAGKSARFIWTGASQTFYDLGYFAGVGIVVACVLALGLWLARRSLRAGGATCVALLAGALVTLTVAAVGRASTLGPNVGRSERYLHLVAALSLPAIALAIEAAARHFRVLAVLASAALMLGTAGNVRLLDGWAKRHGFTLGAKQLTLTYPHVPQATEVPRATIVGGFGAADDGPTIGWLLDGVREKRIPSPDQNAALIPVAERNLLRAAREKPSATRR